MSKSDRATLYSPAGDKYETGDRAEITRLKSYGYSETKPTPKQAAAAAAAPVKP